jgi:hypothetical protein
VVQMRHFLAIGVGTGRVESVSLVLGERQIGRVADVERAECGCVAN